ncbi:MAG: penicillin acylase family protein, partial [Gemmatimonadota bacterium]
GIHQAPEFRARRIQARLLALPRGEVTVDEMAGIHAERTSIPGQVLAQAVVAASAEGAASAGASGGDLAAARARALELLRDWDGRMDRELAAPTVYTAMRAALLRRLARHLLGKQADAVLGGVPGSEPVLRAIAVEVVGALQGGDRWLLPEGEDWPALLRAAFEEGVDGLVRALGSDPDSWTWGEAHRTRPRHPLSEVFPESASLLDPPSVAMHGDGDTPLAGSFALAGSTHRVAIAGLSVNRYIHDPSDWSQSKWIVPLGASGHPGSPHYADQAPLWADVEYIPQLWEWETIATEAESAQRLEPGAR